MLENAMVMRNGYGIRDAQEQEGVPVEDVMGTEILDGDAYIVYEGDVVLEENLAEYLVKHHGAEKRYA